MDDQTPAIRPTVEQLERVVAEAQRRLDEAKEKREKAREEAQYWDSEVRNRAAKLTQCEIELRQRKEDT